MTWHLRKHEAWPTLPYAMDDEALTQIRNAASRELALANERFRPENELFLGKRVGSQRRGWRKCVGGIAGERIGLDIDQL